MIFVPQTNNAQMMVVIAKLVGVRHPSRGKCSAVVRRKYQVSPSVATSNATTSARMPAAMTHRDVYALR